MEDDTVYNTWLHQSFSGKLKFRKLENNLYELDETDRKPSISITSSENIICWRGGTDYGHIVALHIAKSRIHKIEDNPPLWFKEQFEQSFNDLNPKDL